MQSDIRAHFSDLVQRMWPEIITEFVYTGFNSSIV